MDFIHFQTSTPWHILITFELFLYIARWRVRTHIYCQPPAGGHIRSKVIKYDAYGVAIMHGRRGGREGV
jgi:hypothetical protein